MTKTLTTLSALLWVLCSVSPIFAAEMERGEKLHQEQCMSCHDTTIYTRPHHYVTSFAILKQQVKRCEVPSNAKWTESDITSVVNYLNSHYYHFPTP